MSIQSRQKNNASQLLKIGLVANILEWYEFSIYGYLAVVMGQLFLAPTQSISGLLQSWFIFSVGYLARPLGSFFYGWLGDKAGHSYSLKSSLLTMAIPTILIGILPTYSSIGFLATLALLILRFIQGFAAGGELPVSACYIFEKAPTQRRGIFCTTVSVGLIMGLLIGSLITSLLYNFVGQAQILNGAWRIPYLLSIPLTLWIAYIRKTISHSDFDRVNAKTQFKLADQLLVLKKLFQSKLFPLLLLVGFMEICVYIILFWLPSYLNHFLNIPLSTAQAFNTFLLLIQIPFYLLAGYLCDQYGYKNVLILHIIASLLLSYPLFQGLSDGFGILTLVHVVFAWLISGIAPIMMETLGHAYPKAIRCSGMSITHTLGATLFGGTTPFICTWLTHKTGWLMFPAFYMMCFGILALYLLVFRLRKV